MRICIVDTCYPRFLEHMAARGWPHSSTYAGALGELFDTGFGTADFYSRHLRALGHDVVDLVANAPPLRALWTAEHGGARVPPLRTGRRAERAAQLWTVAAQVRALRPEVLYVQDVTFFPPALLASLARYARLVVGQVAAPLPPDLRLDAFDLVVSSFPHYVSALRAQGVATAYLPLAFEPSLLERTNGTAGVTGATGVTGTERDLACTFIGGIGEAHSSRRAFLERVIERLAGRVDVDVYGYGREQLPTSSPIAARHKGEVWGMDMFRVLRRSRVTLNHHIDVARNSANNMRLFEATGCGALLVTDQRANLGELFDVGREVVAYADADEAAELVARYTSATDGARERIARAGQERTLRDHTWAARMVVLEDILAQALAGRKRTPSRRPSPLRRLARRARALVRRVAPSRALPGMNGGRVVSTPLVPLLDEGDAAQLAEAWQDDAIPPRQLALVDEQLAAFARREPVPVFDAFVELLRRNLGDLGEQTLLEVGCASGYYADVLRVAGLRGRYTGCDSSRAFVGLARSLRPALPFAVSDATRLDYADAAFDIVVSGCCLLHIADWRAAVHEAARVSRRWVLFHRTPLRARGPTAAYRKEAWGVPCLELHFARDELDEAFAAAGLRVVDRELTSERTPEPDGGVAIYESILCTR